jgi:hypothetical protein
MVKNAPPAWVTSVHFDYKKLNQTQRAELDKYIVSELRAGSTRSQILHAVGISKGQFDYRRALISRAHENLRGRTATQDKIVRAAKAVKDRVAGKPAPEPEAPPAPIVAQDNTPVAGRMLNPKYQDLSDDAIDAWPWPDIKHVVASRPGGCCWPQGMPGRSGFHFCNRELIHHARYCEAHVAIAIITRPAKISARGGR